MKARSIITAGVAALGLAGAVWILWPGPLVEEVAPVDRGPLRVTVEGPGKARVRDRFAVAAPVPGHLARIAVRAGDPVRAGEVIAMVQPATPPPIDERTRGELQARLEAARAAEAEARAARERAEHAAAQAARERARARSLAAAGSMTPRDLDAAESAAEESAHAVEMAGAALQRAGREVEATRALLGVRAGPGGTGVAVRAPVAGRVLRVLQESEGPVAAGTPLLEIGDPDRIELRVDLLTSEAVRVRPGAQVDLVNWGGTGSSPGGCGWSSRRRSPRCRPSASRSNGCTSSWTRPGPGRGHRSPTVTPPTGASWWPSGPTRCASGPARSSARREAGPSSSSRRAGPASGRSRSATGAGTPSRSSRDSPREPGCWSIPATRYATERACAPPPVEASRSAASRSGACPP